MSSQVFEISKCGDSTSSLGKLFPCLNTLSVRKKKMFLIWCSHGNFLFFKPLGTAEKSLASLFPPNSWMSCALLSPCYYAKSCLRSLRSCLLICASLLIVFSPFPTCWDRPCLSLEDITLESPPALLHLSSFQGCIPWESSRQITEVGEVCFPHCISSWSVQPSLPSPFTTMTTFALFTSIKSSRGPFLVVSLIICIQKLSWTHSSNLFEPYWVVLPKNTVVNVPKEPGPVNEVLLPVFWRQFKLYFRPQTPTPTPPMSVCPLVFTHKLLTEPWLVSKQRPIHTAALTSRATVLSLPSQPVLLKNTVSVNYSPSSRKPSHHASTTLVRSQPCYCSRTCNPSFCSQANMLHKRSPPHFPKKLQDTAPYAVNEHVNSQWLQQNYTRNIPFHKLLAQSESYQKRKVAQCITDGC